MCSYFWPLVKKDLKLMVSSKFLFLTVGSLLLYSCYINLIYVNMNQEIYPVYLYEPSYAERNLPENGQLENNLSEDKTSVDAKVEAGNSGEDKTGKIINVASREVLHQKCKDGYAVGIDASGDKPQIYMVESGIESTDNYRAAYAISLLPDRLNPGGDRDKKEKCAIEFIGENNKEMKDRRDITSEFLFFELAAVGFLGLASLLFKEKQMGVIRVHGILPVKKSFFILSKLVLFLISDIVFALLLTVINLGILEGIKVFPAVLVHTAIASLLMALLGFLCAIILPDFKQFSLLYLVLAVFITTPVFLAGQTGIAWDWIHYHPMYHLFMAMKNAYWGKHTGSAIYYAACGIAILGLLLLTYRALTREMVKEG